MRTDFYILSHLWIVPVSCLHFEKLGYAEPTPSNDILRTPDSDVARDVRVTDFKTLRWREPLQRSRNRRVQAQSFVDDTIEMIQVPKFLVLDVIRGADVQSYFLTQYRNMFTVAGEFVEYVG